LRSTSATPPWIAACGIFHRPVRGSISPIPAVIPDQFDLTIARKERSFRARMVWRSVDEAGVTFLGEYNNEMPVSLDLARRLRQSEAEKAVLRKRIAQLTDNGAA
jgi:hypothetical protein